MYKFESLDELVWPVQEGGVAELDFDLLTPAAMIETAERKFAEEFDPDLKDAHIACIALRQWQSRVDEDVALIERLADADFTITYHAETGASPDQRDGSISLTASMWFATIHDADVALVGFGAEARQASFTPLTLGSAGRCIRFNVGLSAFSAS